MDRLKLALSYQLTGVHLIDANRQIPKKITSLHHNQFCSRQPASGQIASATPLHLTTPSSCLQDNVFSPSLDSQTSEEPNWDQLQSDAQSVASSCSEQPSLPSCSSSISSFTPASHLKMEMDSPLALLNLSKEDSFLVTLTPDKPPTASLVEKMSNMAVKDDKLEHVEPKKQEVATVKVEVKETPCQAGGNGNTAEVKEALMTPKNKQADIKALKRRLSAIKENRDPVKPLRNASTASEANDKRRSLASVQPRLGLGLVKSRQGIDAADAEVKKTSSLSKVSQSKPALLNSSKLNKTPATPISLKQKTPLTLSKSKQAGATMAPPAQRNEKKSVRGRGISFNASPALVAQTEPVSVGVLPNLSPSVSESGLSEVASSPLGPPQASSSTPSRKGQVLSSDVKADPKMPQLKGSATSRTSQFGQVKPRLFSAKPLTAAISKPTRPEVGTVRAKEVLNSSIHSTRNPPKKSIASSLNTTGPSSFSTGGTSPKKVGTPMLRPPISRLRPPNSGLKPPSSGLRLPSAGLRPASSSEQSSMMSTPKMRPPSAIRPPSASLSRQGLFYNGFQFLLLNFQFLLLNFQFFLLNFQFFTLNFQFLLLTLDLHLQDFQPLPSPGYDPLFPRHRYIVVQSEFQFKWFNLSDNSLSRWLAPCTPPLGESYRLQFGVNSSFLQLIFHSSFHTLFFESVCGLLKEYLWR